jgi:hypothetical protein
VHHVSPIVMRVPSFMGLLSRLNRSRRLTKALFLLTLKVEFTLLIMKQRSEKNFCRQEKNVV